MTENEKPEGAHRCEAYKQCAHWAFNIFEHPTTGDRGWLCEECGRFHEKSGWTKVKPSTIKTATFTLEVEYDSESTDPDWISHSLDKLLETATSTTGVLDECGSICIGEFTPVE